MLAGGLVKSGEAFGYSPTRRKVEEHSGSDRHPALTPPTLFWYSKCTRNTDRRVNTVVQTHTWHSQDNLSMHENLHEHRQIHRHCRNKDTHKLHEIVKRKKKNTVWVVHSVITAAVKSLEAALDSQTAREEANQAAGTLTIRRPLHFCRAGRL